MSYNLINYSRLNALSEYTEDYLIPVEISLSASRNSSDDRVKTWQATLIPNLSKKGMAIMTVDGTIKMQHNIGDLSKYYNLSLLC